MYRNCWMSHMAQFTYALKPNVDIIRNVPQSISILIQQGDNDIATPLQQAFILQQALIDARHPDHTLITYPNLGHGFGRQSEWFPILEGFQPYVLADPLFMACCSFWIYTYSHFYALISIFFFL